MLETLINSEKLKVNESFIKYFDSKELNKAPVIFIHGLTGNHFQLQFYRDFLKSKYRVIEVDLRGRGDSGKAEINSTIFKHAKDIEQLIENLNLNNPILIGYSMGGYIASLIAAKLGIKTLVLLDSAAEVDDYQDSIVIPTFDRLSNKYLSREEYVENIIKKYIGMGMVDSNELRTAVNYELIEKNDGFYNKADEVTIRSDWASMKEFNIKKVSLELTGDVLLVQAEGNVGNSGPLFKEEHYTDTKKYLNNLEVFKTKANHYTLVFENQKEINDKIIEFIGRSQND